MSNSETDMDTVSGASFKSRSSISSLSESTTSNPPVTDCERRTMDAIQSVDKNIATHRAIIEKEKASGNHGYIPSIQKSIDVFLEIKKNMVSELRTIPPCLDPNCTDHTILKSNDSVLDLSNLNDKKQPQKRKIKKIRMALPFPRKLLDPSPQRKYFNPSLRRIILNP
ncbi:hypothetical protein TNIN_52441 [Trichonephila inaurata madagascariensis]|uniref:Uncharacterized protein n=1 Tax=Trichonephila inaurata madagascariensis TaxID=2747483 RepID=A0A8X6MCX4_9ARAC|nr:hypothetical protein TNIN_52441 [Trichonephila inaurata madagascariensis]